MRSSPSNRSAYENIKNKNDYVKGNEVITLCIEHNEICIFLHSTGT